MKRLRWRAAAAIVTVLAVGVACSGDDERSEAISSHIHGLAEVDGDLFVATHHGLFAVAPDGTTRQVSQDDHDFMGFTVADDGTFLASGHPSSVNDLPANLGLLESTDGGVTWESVSLLGDVDFHALDAQGDVIYGFNSVRGQLMSSNDRSFWTDFHHDFGVADLAIAPDDDDALVITTEDGPRRSVDGAESFELIDGAPLLMLVDWPREEELYGITPGGEVFVSADGGTSWEERGTLDARPQAMTVAADGTLYAATPEAIVASDDGGVSFTVVVDLAESTRL
jgi:hypothetical protein